jgi:adenylate cyclase
MTEIILAHQGTIDKYIGDCIMAFWNAPLDDPAHERHAVQAAQAMRRRLRELNAAWAAEAAAAGRPFQPVRIGIGINTGECCVGNLGSDQRFDYSVLGDAVNLASRLEGLGKTYGVDLVLGETTAAQLPADWPLVELDLVAVKGKSEPARVFTALPEMDEAGEAPRPHDALERHARMLAAYRGRDWAGAAGLIAGTLPRELPTLAALYALYRERMTRMEAPPEDWNGVYAATEK